MRNFEKQDIVEVLSRYIELLPRGRGKDVYYVACCPFHDDNNPSLVVYPNASADESKWKCNVCHDKWQDVIDFVMQIEECTFPEALKLCANGIDLGDAFLRSLAETDDTSKQEYIQIAERCNALLQIEDLAVANKVFERVDGYLDEGSFFLADKLLRRYRV